MCVYFPYIAKKNEKESRPGFAPNLAPCFPMEEQSDLGYKLRFVQMSETSAFKEVDISSSELWSQGAAFSDRRAVQ